MADGAITLEYLTADQRRVVEAVGRWLRRDGGAAGRASEFYLAGAAGVGKTALVRALVGIDYHVAPTGKAAHVLRRKGVDGAMTLHKLLYSPAGESSEEIDRLREQYAAATSQDDRDRLMLEIAAAKTRARPTFRVNPDSAAHGATVAVDECSMVGDRMMADLVAIARRVLWIGDPYQLPPVRDASPFVGRRPDAELVEIIRQQAGSPIIRLATGIRRGDYDHVIDLPDGADVNAQGAVYVWRGRRPPPEVFTDADVIIVYRNETRRRFNERMRAVRGFSGDMPEPDERVVVLRNDYDAGVWNGGVYTLRGYRAEGADLDDDAGAYPEVPIWLGSDPRDCPRDMVPVDYGYAMTCHKMQGSEADRVCLYAENWDRSWLYTAVTRARRRVDLVIP